MGRYLAARFTQGVIVIFLVSLATFAIMRLMPGDPVLLLLGEGEIRITNDQIEAVKEKWGLNEPYHRQYLIWAGNLLRGDFGESLIRRGVPVRQMIFEAFPVTLTLNVFAMVVSLSIAIPIGIMAALRKNSMLDHATSVGSALGIAMPNFWFGLMLIVVFSLLLRWLPPFGLRSWQGYIMPVIVLATEQMAVLARVMRSSTMEVLTKDYVRTAHAKGLARRTVFTRHAVRNALLPIVTVVGFQIAFILSGTIVVETVFALPGIGRLFMDSVVRLDYQVVQTLVVLFALLVVVANLFTDLVYYLVDPRIRVPS